MIKVIAALLILGGIAGIIVSALTWLELSTTNATAGFLVIIFGLSIWVGVNLWRGIPQAYTWSKILFALQIPAITSSGLVYQFYTAVMLCLTFERQPDTKLGLDFQLGSSVNFLVSSNPEHFAVGVNLVALAVLIYLMNMPQSEKKGMA